MAIETSTTATESSSSPDQTSTTSRVSVENEPSTAQIVAEAAEANGPGLTVVTGEVKPNPKSFEALRASRAERLAAASRQSPAANAPVVSPKPADKPADAPPTSAKVTVPIDSEKLDAFVKLNETIRQQNAVIEELKGKSTAFERFQQYEALRKAGKHVEAANLIGFDMDAANMELLGQKPADVVDPRIAALQEEIAALKANDQSRSAAEIAEAREAGKAATFEHVKEHATEFPLLSRSERWVNAALDRAQKAHDAFVAKEKRQMTIAEKDELVLSALKQEEADRAEDAKLYGATPNDRNEGSSTTQSQGSTGQTITTTHRGPLSTPGNKPKQKMSFEQVKKMRREAANS